ncbi:MAG: hypothetical protein NVS4B11_37890 [Ktedonobacteraceae bacterium]
MHHLLEEAFPLFGGEFADVVGQTLGTEGTLLLFLRALRISPFGQSLFTIAVP